MKKVISALLSAVLMLSVFSFAAVGASTEENSSLSSTSLAKQKWNMAYDSFYSGFSEAKSVKIRYPADSKCVVRPGLIYPMSSIGIPTSDSKLLLATVKTMKTPAQFEALMTHKNEYGAVIEHTSTGEYFGEAYVFFDPETKEARMQYSQEYKVGEFKERESMTITEGLENQLLAKKFSPETTSARALRLLRYAHGVYFKDGENVAFYCSGVISLDGGGLKPGNLYTLAEILQDMENIANFKPEN